ncbi:MAG: hypothetical protein LW860_17260 [Xanthomonadaceae bacterium]|nr:hypothetical protein [Xanthomonadaceae bacterium]
MPHTAAQRVPIRFAFAMLLATGAAVAHAQSSTELASVEVALDAGAISAPIPLDVPDGARELVVSIAGTDAAAGDLDLALSAQAGFVLPAFAQPADARAVADYWAAAPGDDVLRIDRHLRVPLAPGRWAVRVLNPGPQRASGRLRAVIDTATADTARFDLVFDDLAADCDTAPWRDPRVLAPPPGQSATTLGAQRRAAFAFAAERVAAALPPGPPIRVQPCWRDLGGSATSATLAAGLPLGWLRRADSEQRRTLAGLVEVAAGPFEAIPRGHTWLTAAAGSRLQGAAWCALARLPCPAASVRVDFNTAVDGPLALGALGFDYALQPRACAGRPAVDCDVDFVSVAMHELVHGLGFSSFYATFEQIQPAGEALDGFDDAYGAQVVDFRAGAATRLQPLSALAAAQRLAALGSPDGVRWNDPAAVDDAANPLRARSAPDNLVALESGAPFRAGRSLIHVAGELGDAGLMKADLERAYRSLGLARPMLDPLGWWRTVPPRGNAPRVFEGTWFDPARNGHGLEFGAVGSGHFALFYSYGADGRPEWFLAAGRLVDGVFAADRSAEGPSLLAYRYVGNDPPSGAPRAAESGTLRLDFREPGRHPACRDGLPRDASARALMTWEVAGGGVRRWCLTRVVPPLAPRPIDYSGLWYAGEADRGWGLTVTEFDAGAARGVFIGVFHPDAEGRPRWVYAHSDRFDPQGGTYILFERRGYARDAALPDEIAAGRFDDVPVGTMRIRFPSTRGGDDGRIDVEIGSRALPASRFTRSGSPLRVLSDPRPAE